MTLRRFGISACTANPEGRPPSLAQHGSCWRPTPSPSLSFQDTHTGDPFLAASVTDGEAVVGVAHLGRRANARQQTALEWLYPSCAAEGCTAVACLENDHRVDWAASHTTV